MKLLGLSIVLISLLLLTLISTALTRETTATNDFDQSIPIPPRISAAVFKIDYLPGGPYGSGLATIAGPADLNFYQILPDGRISYYNHLDPWTFNASFVHTQGTTTYRGEGPYLTVGLNWDPSNNTYEIGYHLSPIFWTDVRLDGTTTTGQTYLTPYYGDAGRSCVGGTVAISGNSVTFSEGICMEASGIVRWRTPGFTGTAVSPTPSPTPSPTATVSPTPSPSPTSTPPAITSVERSLLGKFFLDGFDENNTFTVNVTWNGSPGKVRFQVDDSAPFDVAGNASAASYQFNMGTSFTPGFSPKVIKMTPINGENSSGLPVVQDLYVFPHPTWLQTALQTQGDALSFSTENGQMKASLKFSTPVKKAYLTFPEWVPFVAGDFGMRNFSANAAGSVTSAGTGSFDVGGSITFKGLGSQFEVSDSGHGDFLLDSNGGFTIPHANLNVSGSTSINKSWGLLDAVPGLSAFNVIPPIRRVNQYARITAEAKPSVQFQGNWKQNGSGELGFDSGTGTIGIDFTGKLSSKITDRIFMEAYVAGGGNVVLGAPEPILKGGELKFEAGAKIKIDKFFGGLNFEPKYVYKCNWIANTDPDSPPLPNCFKGGPASF